MLHFTARKGFLDLTKLNIKSSTLQPLYGLQKHFTGRVREEKNDNNNNNNENTAPTVLQGS